jgi:hypothetical protein
LLPHAATLLGRGSLGTGKSLSFVGLHEKRLHRDGSLCLTVVGYSSLALQRGAIGWCLRFLLESSRRWVGLRGPSALSFMKSASIEMGLSASQWWATRRLRYNVVLLVGAFASFLSLLAVGWGFAARLPCLEITAFSIVIGGILFLAGLGLANICFYLGPLSERWVHPKNVDVFRRWAFLLGTAFSLALVFLPVAINVAAALFPSVIGGQCE